MITRPLVATGARVVAIEPDAQFAARLARACPDARVVRRDVRIFAWPTEPFSVVANLPFAHASEICRALLTDPALPLVSLDAIVEWDFAIKRARVWPSTVTSVIWSAWYELAIVRRLPPSTFVPPPRVAAAVFRARRRNEPLVPLEEARAFGSFVAAAFRAGRVPGLGRGLLPRDLDAHAWAALWQERPRSRVTSNR